MVEHNTKSKQKKEEPTPTEIMVENRKFVKLHTKYSQKVSMECKLSEGNIAFEQSSNKCRACHLRLNVPHTEVLDIPLPLG